VRLARPPDLWAADALAGSVGRQGCGPRESCRTGAGMVGDDNATKPFHDNLPNISGLFPYATKPASSAMLKSPSRAASFCQRDRGLCRAGLVLPHLPQLGTHDHEREIGP
jgi:hypothetical protein